MTTHPQPPAVTRKSVTGFVTKLVGDSATYGFINDEIFFQQMNVVGNDGPAAVNDRVFAECEYSAHLPIKWNATSVKIISKAVAGHSQPLQQQQPLQAANLESDPRKQSRQNLMNQQSQPIQTPTSIQSHQQFNPQQQSANLMAPTYQQHRQQRQLQTLDAAQSHDNEVSQADQSIRLMDQTVSNPNDLYYAGINNQQPFVTAPSQMEVQPFQDPPMGPPKITFTSQLGSAFVQSPIISTAFLQQPPPVLPQQQHSSLSQPNNQHNQRLQQHGSQHIKGTRFNNQGEKNDRHPIRREKFDRNDGRGDRNDGRFNNQNKSNDRESSFNSRNSRQNDSRDRSANRGQQNKRADEIASKAYQPVHSSSMRSTTSVSSERGSNKTRRNYDAQNIPKGLILADLNNWNMKNRCSSSIHVPSDLKYIKVNRHFRLDIKNTPKPLSYKIEPAKCESNLVEESNPTDDEHEKSLVMETSAADANETTDNTVAEAPQDSVQQKAIVSNSNESHDSGNSSSVTKKDDDTTVLPILKTDIKLNHKYCVKIILLSLPELDAIYKKVFGSNFDSFSENRTNPRIDEVIELLCNKGSNGGHSFIGGKFDPVIDGFLEGQTNKFERCGRQPDLIATCRRVVQEQTGLDLGPCKSWTLISTFIYNNKSDYFSPKASVEYSFIYMPNIWTMQSDSFDGNMIGKTMPDDGDMGVEEKTTDVNSCSNIMITKQDVNNEIFTDQQDVISQQSVTDHQDVTGQQNVSDDQDVTDDQDITGQRDVTDHQDVTDQRDISGKQIVSDERVDQAQGLHDVVDQTCSLDPNNLADLKVVDLKYELDRRDVKYKPNAKKAELVALLHESLIQGKSQSVAEVSATLVESTTNSDAQAIEHPAPSDQLEEGEVASDSPEGEDGDATVKSSANHEEQNLSGATKRKASEVDEISTKGDSSEIKRVCTEAVSESMEDTNKGPIKVSLIREPFVVRCRGGQQQLSLISLYNATQVSRYDQFELSVASSILRESLIQHLAEYIFTTLVENYYRRTPAANVADSASNSHEITINDSDNNNNTSRNPSKSNSSTAMDQGSLKEHPVARYINLAFAYFDSAHTGYLNADDLSKLFNNTNLTLSKRALVALIGEGDKFAYRTLPDLSHQLSLGHIYKFPEQFDQLPGVSAAIDDHVDLTGARMIEFQGVSYDLRSLIEQVKDAEGLRLNLVDRFNYAIENCDKQAQEIHALEVNQQSLSRAIKTQNDEICELKRDRDSLKKKFEYLRKGLKGAIGTLSELVKDEPAKKDT